MIYESNRCNRVYVFINHLSNNYMIIMNLAIKVNFN